MADEGVAVKLTRECRTHGIWDGLIESACPTCLVELRKENSTLEIRAFGAEMAALKLGGLVDDLREQLAKSEAERLEQARINGKGSEREARLLAKLADAENRNKKLRYRLAEIIGYCAQENHDGEPWDTINGLARGEITLSGSGPDYESSPECVSDPSAAAPPPTPEAP